MRTRRPVQAALLVSLCLLPFGLGARRSTGLRDDFAEIRRAVTECNERAAAPEPEPEEQLGLF